MRLTYAIVAFMTLVACTAAPRGVDPDATAVQPDSDVSATEIGSISEPDPARSGVQCRKDTTTGTRVKRRTCEPPKDDSELIPLISEPRH